MKKILIVALLITSIATSDSFADEASHKKTALKLLEVMNIEQTLDQVMTLMDDMMEQQFKAADLSPKGQEAMASYQDEIMDWFSEFFKWELLKDLYVDIYSEVFTEEELKELIKFYQSPIGQKLLEKMPELMQKSMEKTQEIVLNKMPEFQERLQKAMSELEEMYKDK